MPPLRLRYQTIEFGALDIHVRTLRDTNEFSDDGGEAEALGISSATWSLFGVVWASGVALARLMVDYEIAGRRVLEIGCGIGLASLVLQHRRSDVTATDYHPEAEAFLSVNSRLNDRGDIPFVRADWDDADVELGQFDLIIGSDLLYERGHAESLAGFIERHSRDACEVLLLDPGRGHVGQFARRMEANGSVYSKQTASEGDDPEAPYRGVVHRFLRSASSS